MTVLRPEQVGLAGLFTDLLEARPRGVFTHLIADRVAEIPVVS